MVILIITCQLLSGIEVTLFDKKADREIMKYWREYYTTHPESSDCESLSEAESCSSSDESETESDSSELSESETVPPALPPRNRELLNAATCTNAETPPLPRLHPRLMRTYANAGALQAAIPEQTENRAINEYLKQEVRYQPCLNRRGKMVSPPKVPQHIPPKNGQSSAGVFEESSPFVSEKTVQKLSK